MNRAVASFPSILFPLQKKAAGVSHEQQTSTLDARPHQLRIQDSDWYSQAVSRAADGRGREERSDHCEPG